MRYVCIYPSGYTLDASESSRYAASYTSMSAMEAGEDGQLSDDLTVDIIHGDASNNWSGGPDTNAVTFDGWDCSSGTYKVTIRTLTAAQSSNSTSSMPDYSGGARDTSEYILKVTSSADTLEIDNDYSAGNDLNIEFIGVQIEHSGTAGLALQAVNNATHSGIVFDKCWVYQSSATIACQFRGDAAVVTTLQNSVVQGDGSNAAGGVLWYYPDSEAGLVVASTVFGFASYGISESGDHNCTAVNNIVANNGGTDFAGNVLDYEGTNNATDDGNSPGTDVSAYDSDWDNEIGAAWTDIRPLNSGNIYQGGVDSGDATWGAYLPSDDILGNSRPASGTGHTIGAFEYASAGGGSLEVEVYDPITISEDVDASMPLAGVSVFDSIEIAEDVTVSIPLLVNIFDALTVAEDLGEDVPLPANVSDTITLTEYLDALKDSLPDVYDAVTIAEVVQAALNLSVSVYDDLTVSEDISMTIAEAASLTQSVFDSLTISESIDLLLSISDVVVSDTITLTEYVRARLTSLAATRIRGLLLGVY